MIPSSQTLHLDLEASGIRTFLDGVVLDAGRLRLEWVYGEAEELTETSLGSALGGPAGVAVDRRGFVYVADPRGDRVLRVPACGGEPEELRCLSSLLDKPRGLAAGARDTLYVADSGHGRILLVDLPTLQLRGAWGADIGDVVLTQPAELQEPWDLAADANGRIYVVDRAARRIHRFDAGGRLESAFAQAIDAEQTSPSNPEYVAVTVADGEELLVVWDRITAGRSRIFVYDLDGRYIDAVTSRLRDALRASAPTLLRRPPAAIAGSERSIVMVETATGAMLRFGVDGRFHGASRGTRAGIAGVTIDKDGHVLVSSEASLLSRLSTGEARSEGAFRLGPFPAPSGRPTRWRRLAAAAALPPGAHLTLYALPTDDPAVDPPSLPGTAAGAGPWHALPPDAVDGRIGGEPSRFVWIGGRLQSGSGEPVIEGFRVTHGGEGWLRHLPALYARETPEAVLEPALELLEAALADEDVLIDDLPSLFDPAATPPERLPWLAELVSLQLQAALDEEALRAAVGAAFSLNARRGTAEALKRQLRLELGVEAAVQEPRTALWRLGSPGSALGAETGLAATEADGAVLDATAILDRSVLEEEHERGSSTLGDLAGRYCVRVYAADLPTPHARRLLERIVERDQPLGTEAHVCVIEPRLRVGVQGSVGIDAVVSRRGTPMRLGTDGLLGADAALAGERSRRLIVGDRARVTRAPAMTQGGHG